MTILVLLILFGVYEYFVEKSLLKAFLFIYSSTYFTCCVWTALAFVLAIFLRLDSMKEVFEKMLDSKEVLIPELDSKSKNVAIKVQTIDEEQEDIKVIRGMIEIYSDLIGLYDNVNLCYSFSTMLCYGLVFFNSLFSNFMMVKDYIRLGRVNPASQIAFLYLSLYSVMFLGLVAVNSLAARSVSGEVIIIEYLICCICF